jgi:hypothetical protein
MNAADKGAEQPAMTAQEFLQLFAPLAADLDDRQFLVEKRPLLAHYTSIEVLEKIMRTGEIWFSNPLVMNDLEEVRFGVLEGVRLFEQSEAVTKACQSNERAIILRNAFSYYFTQFNEQHVFDTYVFCLSQHDPENTDGLLSMWRGYGGNGNGAALIFNTSFVVPDDNSPLIIARVHYDTADGRRLWLTDRINQWCALLEKSSIPDQMLHVAAYQLFLLIKFFALKSKHHGFKEEREWRIIYSREGDDKRDAFKFDYFIGKRGVEPKLKFEIKPLSPNQTWTFETILEQIILGPSLSSWLARRGVERMLDTLRKSEFKAKLSVSGIPLRPT